MTVLIFFASLGWSDFNLDGFEIYDVSSAILSPNGVLAVMDNDPKQLVLFSAEGKLLGRFGRSGSGPKEFGYVPEMFWHSEWEAFGCFSETQNRISYWKEDGTFLKVVPIPRFQWTESIHVLPDGALIFLSDKFGYAKKTPKIHLVRDSDHQILLESQMEHKLFGTAKTDMGPFGMVNDFHPRLLMDVANQQIVYCNSQSPNVVVTNLQLQTQYILKPSLQTFEVTDDYLREWLKTHEHFVQDMVKLKNIERPKELPMVSQVLLDDSDRVWIFGQRAPVSRKHEVQVFERETLIWLGFLPEIPFQIQGETLFSLKDSEEGFKLLASPKPF